MNWQEIWQSIVNTEPGILEVLLRLGCAMLVGLVIGTEREYTHRPAGMRTHILVALGACVISITGEVMFHQYTPMGGNADPARLSAQVVTGVGFLGAGTIMREGVTVKGLTTAASVWSVACLGIAAGFGYYGLAISGMLFIFVTLTIFEWLQHKLVISKKRDDEFAVKATDISAVLTGIQEIGEKFHAEIRGIRSENTTDGYQITFQADFAGRHKKKHRQQFSDELSAIPGVSEVCVQEAATYAKA